MSLSETANKFTIVENFRGEGVKFFDINTLLEDHESWKTCMTWSVKLLKDYDFDMIAGVDSRGFLFKEVSSIMGKGFTMVRKAGKLPNSVESDIYETEYSKDKLSISNSIPKGTRILIVDDFSVTYGTALTVKRLIEKIDCVCVGMFTLAEIVDHPTKLNTDGLEIVSLFKYSVNSTTTTLYNGLNDKILIEEEIDNYKIERYYPLEFQNNKYSTIVMYHPNMVDIAENIVSNNESARLGTIIWKKFKDDTDDITFENEEYLKDKDIIFIMDPFGDLFSQISIMKVLPRQSIRSLHVYLPYFKCGTMERVNEYGPNTLATADTLSNMLSSGMQHTKTGPIKLTVYDLHTLANRFYFKDIDFCMDSCIDLLKDQISDDTVIVFPDDGAKKRFGDAFKDYTTISCGKVREGTRRIVTCDFGGLPRKVAENISDRKMIIVDDLVQSGLTMIEVCRMLKRKGVKSVSAYVTHVIFPDNAHMRFIDERPEDRFDKFYHTNTNPTISKLITSVKAKTEGGNPFTTLNFESLISVPLGKLKPFVDVYVASTSNVKLEAVYNAFSPIMNCRVFGVSGIESDVPNQPLDIKTTNKGCRNRFSKLQRFTEHTGRKGFLVAIENGIVLENGKSYDYPTIKMSFDKSQEDISISVGKRVEFPTEYYHESFESGGVKTVGDLLKRDYGYDSNSWQHHFNDEWMTRSKNISDKIESLLEWRSLFEIND